MNQETDAVSAAAGVLHVIINGLHPYYLSLSGDAIDECIHQYIFDAVAEFKVSKMMAARLNPDSIRRLKDSLLRARADQLDNADAAVRQQAEAQLFDGASGQAGAQP